MFKLPSRKEKQETIPTICIDNLSIEYVEKDN